jgi:hypothetical protein
MRDSTGWPQATAEVISAQRGVVARIPLLRDALPHAAARRATDRVRRRAVSSRRTLGL